MKTLIPAVMVVLAVGSLALTSCTVVEPTPATSSTTVHTQRTVTAPAATSTTTTTTGAGY